MNYVEVPTGINDVVFKAWLLEHFGLTNHPKADLFWRIAYESGHSGGNQDIFIYAQDLYELISDEA